MKKKVIFFRIIYLFWQASATKLWIRLIFKWCYFVDKMFSYNFLASKPISISKTQRYDQKKWFRANFWKTPNLHTFYFFLYLKKYWIYWKSDCKNELLMSKLARNDVLHGYLQILLAQKKISKKSKWPLAAILDSEKSNHISEKCLYKSWSYWPQELKSSVSCSASKNVYKHIKRAPG